MLASLVSADLNPSHCVNTQSTAGEDARKAFLPTCSSSFLFRLAAMEWCPVRQYDQDRDSHWYSVSMQFIWRACIHISSGNQHLIHNCVGGMFTVDSSQALPSGCKLRPRRIQMDHFPLASQTHNSVEWELLLYSWEEQMPGSIFLAILRFASPPIVLAISRSCTWRSIPTMFWLSQKLFTLPEVRFELHRGSSLCHSRIQPGDQICLFRKKSNQLEGRLGWNRRASLSVRNEIEKGLRAV